MFLSRNRLLLGEYLLLFGVFPLTLAMFKPHGWIYPLLWILGALSWRALQYHGATWKAEWNTVALNRATIRRILLRFIPFAIALLAFTSLMIPDHLFSLPQQKPLVWVMVMLLYPLLSALPQEIIFRSFIFRRFATLFSPRQMMFISAFAFGWAHIILMNWVAVVFSFLGGLLFADTYSKTRSLAAVCFEHALYGCYIFTIGLGFYFYHGNVK